MTKKNEGDEDGHSTSSSLLTVVPSPQTPSTRTSSRNIGRLKTSIMMMTTKKQQQQRKKKCVTFNLCHTEVHEWSCSYSSLYYHSFDPKTLWYNKDDLLLFKDVTLRHVVQISQSEQRNKAPCSYRRVLERAYDACHHLQAKVNKDYYYDDGIKGSDSSSSSSSGGSDAKFRLVDVLGRREREDLARWIRAAPARLGLEQLTIRRLAKDKIMRREKLCALVCKKFHTAATDDDEDEGEDSEEDEMFKETDKNEIIRRKCERITRPSRIFARVIAEANAPKSITKILDSVP